MVRVDGEKWDLVNLKGGAMKNEEARREAVEKEREVGAVERGAATKAKTPSEPEELGAPFTPAEMSDRELLEVPEDEDSLTQKDLKKSGPLPPAAESGTSEEAPSPPEMVVTSDNEAEEEEAADEDEDED